MVEETNEEVVPSEDGIQDEEMAVSSTAEDQSEEATSQQATDKEPPFHEHPRWKELQEERKELRDQNERLQSQLVDILNNNRSTQQQVEDKIYEANTPEEREFWQKVERIADKKSEAKIASIVDQFQAKEKALLNQYGQLAANQFLRDNPDVSRGSDELKEIVQLAREKGLDLDQAKKIVMFDKAQEMAVKKATQRKQEKVQQKLAANVETKPIAKESPISTQAQALADEFDRVASELDVKLY